MILPRNRLLVSAAALIAISGISPSSDAQTIVTRSVQLPNGQIQAIRMALPEGVALPPGFQEADGLAVAPGSASATPDGAASGEFDEHNYRLEKLNLLKFDRSEAAMLKAWAIERLPDDPDLKDEKPEAGDGEADDGANLDGESIEIEVVEAMEEAGDELIQESGDDGAESETGAESGDGKDSEDNPETTDAAGAEADAEAKAKAEAEKAKAEAIEARKKEIDEEVLQFERWVALGRWQDVGSYLAGIREADRAKIYQKLLQALVTNPPNAPQVERQPGVPQAAWPRQYLSADDVIGLADASPVELEEKHLLILSQLLTKSKSSGYVMQRITDLVRKGTPRLGGEEPARRNVAAQLFLNAGMPDQAIEFLPAWPSEEELDSYSLRLLAQYFDGKYVKDQMQEWLMNSWNIHQILLGREDLKTKDRKAVLKRAVELSTLIDQSVGIKWLEDSFTSDVNRGIKILTQIGTITASELGRKIQMPKDRLNALKIQNKAAEALLRVAPEKASEWQQTLTLLADQWNREAEIAHTMKKGGQYGSGMNVDRYGNFYYYGDDEEYSGYRPHQGFAIDVLDLLEIQPSPEWVKAIHVDLQPQVALLQARLNLKVGDEKKAFPMIEQMAKDQPEIARELVHEFLKTWTTNHDPNQERRQYNPYYYIYGYNSNAEAIPLSRSRQERNLKELSEWVSRIRQLPIEPVDESLLASAFTTCHSSAEVFKIESFVEVFGDIQSLKPETVSTLAETMRGNLASVWRNMTNQEEQKTKRKEAEVLQEVLRGYQVALNVVGNAMQKHDTDWKLQLAEATLLFDMNNYVQSVQPNSQYAELRGASFEKFQRAAELYREKAPSLKLTDLKTDVYDYWFYAALGATDLAQLNHLNVPDQKQIPLILAELQRLPGESAELHMSKFANSMFSRLSAVPPASKYRFLKAGFDIVGDHRMAWEAKKTFDYYNDTTSEIKLVAEIDGSDVVGHESPFGVYIKIVHTNEMERESGGFQKYVQNQTQSPYYYNYGRPNEDYRDKFEDGVMQALSENFEVVSITFEDPKNMRSRPAKRDGWRQTPFAYLMLKARGPQIDRLPALQMNLDFRDASGFVVLPIESPAVALDAAGQSPVRPYQNLKIVQTLDERQINDGILTLEVSATANGLIPKLDEILDLNFEGLEVKRIEDQQNLPTGFDREAHEISVVSDRSWLVELGPQPGQSITQFQFCSAQGDDVEIQRQQYRDSDLVDAEPVIVMASKIERTDWKRIGPLAALASVLLIGVIFFARYLLRRPAQTTESSFEMPADVNPFTVLGLLERIQTDGKLKDATRSDLGNSIRDVERYFFAPQNGHEKVELEEIAKTWLRKVK